MKKSVVFLIVLVLLINVLTLGFDIYSLTAKPLTAGASSDTASISLYVNPQAGSTTIVPTEVSTGGSTGVYRTKNATPNGTTAQPNQIVPQQENPLPVNKTFDVYPLLGILGLIALLLVAIWLIIKHMRAERAKKKGKARGKTRRKR